MNLVHAEVEKNIKGVVDNKLGASKKDVMTSNSKIAKKDSKKPYCT